MPIDFYFFLVVKYCLLIDIRITCIQSIIIYLFFYLLQIQQRTQQSKNSVSDYAAAAAAQQHSQQHRNLALSQTKSVEKMQQIKSEPNVGAFSMYGYQSYPAPYHKDLKV